MPPMRGLEGLRVGGASALWGSGSWGWGGDAGCAEGPRSQITVWGRQSIGPGQPYDIRVGQHTPQALQDKPD